MRALRIAGTTFMWLLFVGVVGVAALATLLESGFFTPRIHAYVNDRLERMGGLRLAWDSLYWRPWSGLNIEGVRLTFPGAAAPGPAPEAASPEGPPPAAFGEALHGVLVAIDEVEVAYRFGDLLSGRPRIRRIRVYNPDVDLAAIAEWRARRVVPAAARETAPEREGGGRGLVVEDLEIGGGRVEREHGVLVTNLALGGNLHGLGGLWSLAIDDAAGRVTSGNVDEEVELTGAVSWSEGALRLDGLHFKAGGGRVSFQGRIDPADRYARILTTGYAIPLERIGSWFGVRHPLLTGALEFRFLTKGTLDSLDVDGGLTGVAEDGTGRDIVFSLSRRDDEIGIDSLRLEVGDSQVDVTATLWAEKEPRIDGVATFRRLNPALLLAEEDLARVTDLDGVVRFEGVGLSRDTFEGSAEIEMTSASVFGYGLDGASLSLSASRGDLVLRGARFTRGESVISGVGTIDARNRVAAEFSGNVADLGDVFAGAASDTARSPATGNASAEIRVLGPLAAPGLEADLRFDETSIYGAAARSLDLKIRSESLGGGGELAIVATGRDIGYGGRLIARGTASGVWRSGAMVIRSVQLESDARGELRLGGELTIGMDGSVAGHVAQLDVRSPGGAVRWTNEGPIQIEKREGAWRFTGLDLRGGTGRVHADVVVQGSGDASVSASGRNVDLEVFTPFLLLPREVGGILDFDADILVGADTLAATVELGLVDGRLGEDRLERIDGRVDIGRNRLVFDELALRSSFATADIGGTVTLSEGTFLSALADSAARDALLGKLQLDGIEIHVDSPDLDRVREMFPKVPSPGGAGQLHLLLEGPAVEPSAEFAVEIENARLEGVPVDRFRARGFFDGAVLSLEEARLEARGGTLEASGKLPLAWGVRSPKPRFESGRESDLALVSDRFPVRCVAVLVPFCDFLSGPATADVRLLGAGGDLGLEGTFLLEEATLELPGVEQPFVGGRVEGTLRPAALELTSIRAEDGRGGVATGTGRLDLESLSLRGLRLDLSATRWHYRNPLGVSGIGDGNLVVTLRELADGRHVPYLEGRFEVTRADLQEKLLAPPSESLPLGDVPAGVNVPEEAVRAPGKEEETARALVLARIDLHAKNNVWLTTRQAKVEMTGDVTLHVTEKYAGITGEVKTLQGQYAVFNTEFQIEKGEIEFVDPADPLTSYINAVATTRVLDENVTVEVSGTLGDPLIEMRTESGMTEEEIYELLALRIRRNEETGVPGEDSQVSRDLLASWGALWATRFGREISGELGFDTFEVEPEAGYTMVGVGKRIGSAVFVKYTQQVAGTDPQDPTTIEERNETPERQILLEYRLSDIFQLNGATGTIEGSEYVNIDLRAEWGY